MSLVPGEAVVPLPVDQDSQFVLIDEAIDQHAILMIDPEDRQLTLDAGERAVAPDQRGGVQILWQHGKQITDRPGRGEHQLASLPQRSERIDDVGSDRATVETDRAVDIEDHHIPHSVKSMREAWMTTWRRQQG